MTIQETGRIMTILAAAYPQFYARADQTMEEQAVVLWADAFLEEPVELVIAAVKAYIATDEKGFPPHIGAIKNALHGLCRKEPDAADAWSLVRAAVSNSAYEAREEFDKLPENIQRMVGSPNQLRDWSQMDCDVFNSVVASNFQKAYRQRQQDRRITALIPPDVKRLVSGLTKPMDALEDGT